MIPELDEKLRVKEPLKLRALYTKCAPVHGPEDCNSRKGMRRSSVLPVTPELDEKLRTEERPMLDALYTGCDLVAENRQSSYRERNQLKFLSRTKTWCSNLNIAFSGGVASLRRPEIFLKSWIKSKLPGTEFGVKIDQSSELF